MDLHNIIRKTTGVNTRTTPEKFLSGKINRLKEGAITTIIAFLLAAVIIIAVVLYVGYMILKNI